MNPFPPKKLTGATNELAKERNRGAAERTLVSWIQNCVSLIGFGMAFERIVSAVDRTFPHRDLLLSQLVGYLVGLSAIGLGVSMLLFAIFGYLAEIRTLEQGDGQSFHLFYSSLVGAVVLFGLVTLFILYLVSY